MDFRDTSTKIRPDVKVCCRFTMAATMEAILGAVYLNSNLMMFGEVMQTSGLVLLASQDAENQWTIKHIALTDSESRP